MERSERLRRELAGRDVPWSAPLEWHASLVSTSDLLKEKARRGAPEWTTVLADRQTGGRGREGRVWVSPPGGLYLSVLLRPRFARVGLVPLAVGVAAADTVAELGVAAELKWPNDLLVGGRKLGGILSEASSGVSGVEWVVVGVGLNVDVTPEVAGRGPSEGVTSLARECGKPPAVEAVAASVLTRLRGWYDDLGTRPAVVVEAWRARAVPWWGTLAEVRTGSAVVRGRLRDIDDDGALIVDLEGGGSRRVVSGELARLRPVTAGER